MNNNVEINTDDPIISYYKFKFKLIFIQSQHWFVFHEEWIKIEFSIKDT